VATASAIWNTAYQTSQIVGFVAGAAVVATVGSYRTLGIDTLSFGISALIIMTALGARPAPQRASGKRATMWSVSADGMRIVFGDQAPRALLLFGWLAGFYILSRGLSCPTRARWRHERGAAARQDYRRPALLSGLGATTGAC
jgi:hypothetical protein